MSQSYQPPVPAQPTPDSNGQTPAAPVTGGSFPQPSTAYQPPSGPYVQGSVPTGGANTSNGTGAPWPPAQPAYAYGPDAPATQPYSQQPYGTPPPGAQPYGAPPGAPVAAPYAPYAIVPTYADPNAKSKVAAGLLGIFLGMFGIHRFYLGYTGVGVTMLMLTLIGSVVTFGLAAIAVYIWGLVEGILYLTATRGSYSMDAQHRPLRS